MKFKYVGDPKDRKSLHDEVVMYGMRFPAGEAVEVKDERVIERLSGNSHFEKVSGANPTAKAKPVGEAGIAADLTDAKLRAAIKDAGADAPGPRASRETLVAKFNELNTDGNVN